MEEGQGAVGPAICTAGVPAAEMVCRVNPGMSIMEVRERSNVLEFWAMDIGSVMGGGGGKEAGDAEDLLGAIAGGGVGGSAIASTQCRRQHQSPKFLPPPPSPELRASLARVAMARLLLSLLPSLLVGVAKLILTSLA